MAGAVKGRVPPHTRTLVDRALRKLSRAIPEILESREMSNHTVAELEAIGLSLSRMLSWDVIDEINKAYVEVAVDAMVANGAAAPGRAAKVAVTASDAIYDGFWVYNNHEGFEQALRLGALIDHFPSPTFMLDEFGSITFANGAFCEAVGLSISELDGRKLEDVVVANGPMLEVTESFVKVPDDVTGTRYFRLSISRIDTNEGTEYFGQLIERTGEVHLERTKEQVIATISHELRTPLTAVVGYAELMHNAQLGGHIEVDSDEAMGVIFEQAQHLLALVTDLVDFARLDTGRLRPNCAEVDVRSVLDAVARRLPELETAKLSVRVPHRTHAWADRTRLEQLFTNLLTNAHRYGGPNIIVEAWPRGSGLEMRVSDDGPGIPMEERLRIFDTFYQGDQTHVGDGTGMGLAICKAIVRAHGGSILLEDRPGASFVMFLPGPSQQPAGSDESSA